MVKGSSKIVAGYILVALFSQWGLFRLPVPSSPADSHSLYCFCLNCPGEELCCCGKGQTPLERVFLSQACDQSAATLLLKNAERPVLIPVKHHILAIPEENPSPEKKPFFPQRILIFSMEEPPKTL
ncbi:MAG: hypothetical protein NZ959_00920 [Armatimonadetes bacterium]|nr:hypothetical protein [Armatimonadota bacterium]MDW8121050.1 hypothetical protein [Armatimonadota bacterium]